MSNEKRYSWGNRKLARVFAGIGGYTNALAILSLGITASHVTGLFTNVPIQLIKTKPDYYMFFMFVLAIISYLGGSIIGYSLLRYNGPILPLMMEASIFILIGLLSPSHILDKNTLTVFAAICMGLQNSITTHSPMDRTTHLTGLTTDLGIAIVRKDKKRIRSCRNIILSFILGATLAVIFFHKIGAKGFFIPGLVMMGIIYYEREPIMKIRERLVAYRSKI